MAKRTPFSMFFFVCAASMIAACSSAEPAQVELSVTALPLTDVVTTDLGYRIELEEARIAVENLEFSLRGGSHTASFFDAISEAVVPSAYAHPGHTQDGDVTGELRGRFIFSFLPPDANPVGTATLLVGRYQSVNFTFARATAEDGISSEDPLLSHTAILRGTATREGETISFVALLDSPEERTLSGAPFEFEVREGTELLLGLGIAVEDPYEGDTLFDGLDFGALDVDGDGSVTLGEGASEESLVDAYNLLRRTFQTHDHFTMLAHLPASST